MSATKLAILLGLLVGLIVIGTGCTESMPVTMNESMPVTMSHVRQECTRHLATSIESYTDHDGFVVVCKWETLNVPAQTPGPVQRTPHP